MPENPYDILRERPRQHSRQTAGVLLGLAGAWAAGSLMPALPARLTWATLLLWGAALGGALLSWQSFEQAGKALTRSENRWLNFALGAGIPFGILALLTFLF